MDDLFSGRTMICLHCGWTMKSSPNFQSQWTTIEADGKLMDICPFCWGIPSKMIPQQVKDLRKKTYKPKVV
jgi:hypothetical protein